MRNCIAVIFVLLFYSCAIQVPPGGGDKDILPPEVIKANPKNYSSEVYPKNIEITFNEYIEVKDASTQLIVSPLLEYPVDTKIKKKTLLIRISDTLKTATTYTLNFGNSIRDLNEGNVLENYQYVFSTGSVIDTLKITGKITTALDHKTEKGLLAMLYKEFKDSTVFNNRPLYFAKTNDAGEFTISNIGPGSYHIVALKEQDGNFKYSGGDELIGFADSTVNAGDAGIKLRLSKTQEIPRIIKSYSLSPGAVLIAFSLPVDSFNYNWISDKTKMQFYDQKFTEGKDSLIIYYRNTESDSLTFSYFNGRKTDTVYVRLLKKSNANNAKNKFGLNLSASQINGQQSPVKPLKIISNHPISKLDTSKFILKVDSMSGIIKTISFSDSIQTQLTIDVQWKERSEYRLLILPEGIEDIFGLKNDSIEFKFEVKSESDYGNMQLLVDKGDVNFIVQLLDNTSKVVRESFIKGKTQLSYEYLDPLIYKLRIVYDVNRNNRWDAGDIIKKIQPEITEYYPEDITVRANWDVDLKWTDTKQ